MWVKFGLLANSLRIVIIEGDKKIQKKVEIKIIQHDKAQKCVTNLNTKEQYAWNMYASLLHCNPNICWLDEKNGGTVPPFTNA